MINLQSSNDPEYFDEVNHQNKTIKVGDEIIVNQAGQNKTVTVSCLFRKQGHYWVGYENDAHVCPWPLMRTIKS